jgi:hypothetical protein
MSQLRKGDRIFARCAGWYGYGTVTAEQTGDLVTFKRENAGPDAPLCTVRRERCSFVPSTEPLSTSLGELATGSLERRRMGSYLRLKARE